MILRYNFFLSNNRLCFGIQIPLSRVYARFNSFNISGAFTFCARSNTGAVLYISDIRDNIRFVSIYFTGWYTFLLQEVRKRFFCYKKKKKLKKSKTTYCDLNGCTWTISPSILCNGTPTYLIWIPTQHFRISISIILWWLPRKPLLAACLTTYIQILHISLQIVYVHCFIEPVFYTVIVWYWYG